ncbi:MAG: hypothetical protein ACF8AM_06100, partial [Rhodopirellula sp. JB055]|uniref:hypothetical protein n=1 Tax=Rhodopirellula sp. JB055 TaxID=3342846 RepID=UPI00370B8C11
MTSSDSRRTLSRRWAIFSVVGLFGWLVACESKPQPTLPAATETSDVAGGSVRPLAGTLMEDESEVPQPFVVPAETRKPIDVVESRKLAEQALADG